MNDSLIADLPGPILVIGASGFLGSNLLRRLLSVRQDVFGTFYSNSAWRLQGLPTNNFLYLDLAEHAGVRGLVKRVQPRVIFDCSAFGAYSFEQDYGRITAPTIWALSN